MADFCTQCGKPIDKDGLPADGCFEYPCPQREQIQTHSKDLPATGTGRRLATSMLDFIALLATLTVVDVVIYSAATLFLWTGFAPMIAVLIDVITTVTLAGYWAVRDLDGGKWSPGKRIGQFRVVDAETGRIATTQQALTRNSYYAALILVAAVPFIPFGSAGLILLVMLLDVIVMYASPKNQRIGDWLAGTQVVPVESAST